MLKKFNKKQIFIFSGIILSVILFVFIVIFCINKSKNKIEDTGIKIAEESTNNTTSEKEIVTKSKTDEGKETELETTTEKEKITTKEEKETTELTVTTTNPPTTATPTEAVTQPVKEVVTNPPTTTAVVTNNNNNQYRDPYTGDIISKEEYDSIMNEMNNPEPTTTQAPQENVYVLNDDGTLNFKKSKIYNLPSTEQEQSQFVKLLYKSKEVKNLSGELYFLATKYTVSWSRYSTRPTFFLCISDEYWLVMTFDEDWNIKKGSSGDGIVALYDPDHLPLKEQW